MVFRSGHKGFNRVPRLRDRAGLILHRRRALPPIATALLYYAVCGPVACRAVEKPAAPATIHETPVREVRVRIHAGVREIRVRANGPLRAGSDPARRGKMLAGESWHLFTGQKHGQLLLGGVPIKNARAHIEVVQGDRMTIAKRDGEEWGSPITYYGTLDVTVADDGRLTVLNSVDVELYVACVVAHEVWPTFEREALRAQAIVARTFVLYQMKRRSKLSFDVSATQGSQVYRGIREDNTGRRADRAALDTRGIVATFRDHDIDRIFCTYYSAVCGGLSQPAEIFGSDSAIPPLAGGVPCDYCEIAPGHTYRWGPVRIKLRDVRSRLLAQFPKLGSLRKIDIIARTASGRPTKLRLTDVQGESYEMLAERFRLAVDPMAIRSTDCDIQIRNREVVFSKGRGFGHGLGLCQWGMQGQALQGKRAGEIVRYYYPGAKLTRAY